MNEIQPSLRSRSIEGRTAATRAALGSLSRAMQNAATAQVAASTAIAHPEPNDTTTRAATVGPKMLSALRVKASIAFACWMCERGTTSGTTPCMAGNVKAETTPLMPSRTTIIHSSA